MVFIMKTEAKKLCIIWLKKQCVQNKFSKNSERNLLFLQALEIPFSKKVSSKVSGVWMVFVTVKVVSVCCSC